MTTYSQIIAIIDIGSNSIRLVLFSVVPSGIYKEIQNLKVVARLSSHINEDGKITEQGIDILVKTLLYFQEVISSYCCSTLICVATAAMRQAKNQKDILNYVEKETKIKIRVLSEYEEAIFGYLAVTNSTDYQDGITIDIGGGSTEITLFKNKKLLHYHSFPFGAISLKQRFIHNEIPTKEELRLLRNYIIECLDSLNWLKQAENKRVIGIGGSARNLSLIQQQKTNYPLGGLHQYELLGKEIFLISDQLNQSTLKERQRIDGLSKDRADIIIPAVEVIKGLIQFTDASLFTLSTKGLRDGLFYHEFISQFKIQQLSRVSERSMNLLMDSYGINRAHVDHVIMIATKLFKMIESSQHVPLNEHDLFLLTLSSKLRDIGNFVSHESSSQHTFYILTNQTIDGLSHKDRLKIAAIASFKSKHTLNFYLRPFKNLLTSNELEKLELLGALLKFCSSLNVTKQQLINSIKLMTKTESNVKLSISASRYPYFELISAEKNKKHLERVLKTDIELIHEK